METTKHRVSKIIWHTSIDQKEKAFELQQRISDWTKFHLEREVDKVFNKVCPTNQIWRIQQMNLCLEQINLENLEEELSLQIPRIINEQLNEFILYQNQNKTNVELIDTEKSQIEAVSHYLQKGNLPWWFNSSSSSSLNQLVHQQLQENNGQFISLLLSLGKKSSIRKRLAWQLQDYSLEGIIIGVEPTHYQEIFNFKKELEETQNRDQIIHNDAQGFSKHLWLLILNYLFEDRGTFFNKVTFTRSMIVQLAAHFNMRSEQLLLLIRQSISKLNLKSASKTEFLLVIQRILKDENLEIVNKELSSKEFYQGRLSVLLESNTDSPERAHLISYFLNKDSKILIFKLLNEVKSNPVRFYSSFNRELLEKLYFSFLQTSTLIGSKKDYLQSIYQMLRINGEIINRKDFLVFTISKFHQSDFKNKSDFSFLHDYLHEFSFTKEAIIENLKALKHHHSVSGDGDLLVYKHLSRLRPDFHKKKEGNFNYSVHKTIQSICVEFSGRANNDKRIKSLFNHLKRLISSDTVESLNVLLAWENKSELEPWLLDFLDEKLLEIFFNSHPITEDFQNQLSNLQLKFSKPQFERFSEILLKSYMFHWLMTKKRIKGSLIFEAIWSLVKKSSSACFKDLQVFVEELGALSIISNKSKGYKELLIFIEKQRLKPLYQQIQTFLNSKNGASEKFSEFLLAEINQLGIIKFQKELKVGQFQLIIEAILSSSFLIVEKARVMWFKELGSSFLMENEKDFNLVFWHCCLDLKSHQRSFTFLKQNVLIALKIRFSSLAHFDEGMIVKTKTRVFTKENFSQTKGDEIQLLLQKGKPEGNQNEFLEIDLIQLFEKLSDLSGIGHFINSVFSFHQSLEFLIPKQFKREFDKIFSKQIWNFLNENVNGIGDKELKELMKLVFQFLILHLNLSAESVRIELRDSKHLLTRQMQRALEEKKTIFETELNPLIYNALKNHISDMFKANELIYLAIFLLNRKAIPSHYFFNNEFSPKDYLEEIKNVYPLTLVKAINQIDKVEFLSLKRILPLFEILNLISFSTGKMALFNSLLVLDRAFDQLNNSPFPKKYIQDFMMHKVYLGLHSRNWQGLSEQKFWMELIYYVSVHHQIEKSVVIEELKTLVHLFPVAHRASFESLLNRELEVKRGREKKVLKIPKTENATSAYIIESSPKVLTEALLINNAGLVLANSYVNLLFSRLSLLNDGEFINEESGMEAIYALQYLATGIEKTDEAHLALNKVLCGIHPRDPIFQGLEFSAKKSETIDGLLKAMISHWPSVGESSLQGFRGNWLVREGILLEYEDNWELTVDKKAYDLLLNKSPFSFSYLKFDWMKKPLKVSWPY